MREDHYYKRNAFPQGIKKSETSYKNSKSKFYSNFAFLEREKMAIDIYVEFYRVATLSELFRFAFNSY